MSCLFQHSSKHRLPVTPSTQTRYDGNILYLTFILCPTKRCCPNQSLTIEDSIGGMHSIGEQRAYSLHIFIGVLKNWYQYLCLTRNYYTQCKRHKDLPLQKVFSGGIQEHVTYVSVVSNIT